MAWNFVTFQWQDPDGTRHYYGQSALNGRASNGGVNYYNTEFIMPPDGRTLQEQAPQIGHYAIYRKVI